MVCGAGVGSATEYSDWSPSQGFRGDGSDILELGEIIKRGQAIISNNSVEFFLGSWDKLGAKLGACKEEAG